MCGSLPHRNKSVTLRRYNLLQIGVISMTNTRSRRINALNHKHKSTESMQLLFGIDPYSSDPIDKRLKKAIKRANKEITRLILHEAVSHPLLLGSDNLSRDEREHLSTNQGMMRLHILHTPLKPGMHHGKNGHKF